MSTLADLETELSALKTEVARLREEAALFFIVNRDAAGSVVDTQLRCWRVECEIVDLRERDATESSGMVGADKEGAYLSFWGEDKRVRAMLRVTGNSGELDFYGEDHNAVVQIFEADGHGHVAVFSPGGVPRAVMKGMETGGAVSLVGEEGQPLAILHSTNGKGSVVVLDGKHVQAEMIGGEHGGLVATRGSDHKRGCLLASMPMGNSLLLNDAQGNAGVTIASSPAGNAVSIGGIGSDSDKPTIVIAELPALGGSIIVRNAEAQDAVDISADAGGGSIRVNGPDPAGHVLMETRDGGGRIAVSHANGQSSALVTAPESGGFISAIGADDAAAVLNVGPTGASISVNRRSHIQFFAGSGDENHSAAVVLNNPENTPVVQLLAGREGGTLLAAGSDGTTQAGFAGTDAGGRLTVFSELGVERASLRSAEDGGGLHLKWGGTTGLVAAATESGGLVTAHGPDGHVVQTLPDPENFHAEDEEEQE
jgi:hypothetical protein